MMYIMYINVEYTNYSNYRNLFFSDEEKISATKWVKIKRRFLFKNLRVDYM